MTNQTVSVKKNTERIRICVLFLYLSPLFRQYHCHKPIATIFFSSYFDNAIATNQLRLFFFSLPISAMPLPQIHSHIFFSLYFDNGIATNQLQQFFFPPISAMPLPQIHSTIFFFFFEKWYVHTIFTIFLQQILSSKLLLVVIVGLKK